MPTVRFTDAQLIQVRLALEKHLTEIFLDRNLGNTQATNNALAVVDEAVLELTSKGRRPV